MAKFLITGSYTPEGAKGLIKEGGTGRKAAVQKALKASAASWTPSTTRSVRRMSSLSATCQIRSAPSR